MTRSRYEAKAQELLAPAAHSAKPELVMQYVLEDLERQADDAERRQEHEEEYLARAVAAMERTAHARRAAQRASDEAARIEDERRWERARLRKNARARERYRQRRLTEPVRLDKRVGMHALAIEVDPAAYRALKLESFQRCTTLPKLIGDILRQRVASGDDMPAVAPSPRWRRTGAGRGANQHTRLDIDNASWQALHVAALGTGHTIGRWIGLQLEEWAAQLPDDIARSRSSSHPLRNVDATGEITSGREDPR